MEVENIECTNNGDSSFLLFDSGENHNRININNINVKNSISNGSFIKIKGDSNVININNSSINNIKSYGPIIENISKKSDINITNINFYDNKNVNKYKCGNIQFSKDLNVIIENSIFSNNYCKSNGGAICINDIKNIGLQLSSNIFYNNTAANGGALYLTDGKMIDEEEENNRKIIMNNNTLYYNKAENFGGGIYSECSKLYLSSTTTKNTIIYNKAGIIGGGLYSPSNVNKTTFNIEKWSIKNNTVNSQIDNIGSKPSFITLDTKLPTYNKNNEITVTTGDKISLKFVLHDEYGNRFIDTTNYYSSLILKLSLQKIMVNSEGKNENDYYIIEDNNGVYNNKQFKLMGNSCILNN
ncbi:hypothetical protein PIROE2DRAFT_9518, partial [Piromyces sp. E2]